jgi:TonB-linked SusC/RagA family outer membrane protein
MRVTHTWISGVSIGLLLAHAEPSMAQSALPKALTQLPSVVRSGATVLKPVGTDDTPTPVMERIVALNVRNGSISDVLDMIAEQASVQFVYSDRTISSDRKVTLVNTRLTVQEALNRVLRGMDIVVQANASGTITLMKPTRVDSVPAQKKGRISGRVIDSVTRQPLANVVVAINGTKFAVQTQTDGRYLLPEVPLGPQILTARLIGYTSRQISVNVSESAQEIDILLHATPTQLSGVVTTATGQQERVTVGNSIATINAEEVVADMPIRSISDLLEARAPGLSVVRTSGAVGAGTRLRVRGMRSANMSNDPIVILDGIRISGEALGGDRDANLPGKGTRPSRLDDLDPSTIESIDVLKGPSASALYGSDAANGVIVIKTKRPQAGPPRWQITADRSTTSYSADYPYAVRTFGHSLTGGGATCHLEGVGTGLCPVVDSIVTFNAMRNPLTTPFARGYDSQISANVSGGTQAMRYFLSGSYLDQLGASKVPELNIRIYERVQGAGAASKSMRRPNATNNLNFTGNIFAELGRFADANLRSTLLSRYQRRGNDGYQGALNSQAVRSEGDTVTPVPSSYGFPHERSDKVLRSTTGLSTNIRPYPWATVKAGYGFDFSVNNDRDFVGRNKCQPFCGNSYGGQPDSIGIIWFGRRQTQVKSADIGGTGTWRLPAELGLQISVGGQYSRTSYTDLNGFASNLPAGRKTANAASGTKNIDEITDDAATAGWYFQPRISWRDRMYLSAGFRQDVGNAIGADVRPLYPKWDASYVVSEEDFFESLRGIVNTLRLRAAFGHAGIQPGSFHKLRTFSQLTRFVMPVGAAQNYAMLVGVGNPDLRPERSTEIEWGADIELLESRLRFDLTWFREKTRDAIMQRPLAPSVGTTSSRRENVGEVRNTGMEATIGATLVQNRNISYDFNIGYSSHKNLVVSLGPNVTPFTASFTFRGLDDARVVAGYPLFGRWVKPIVGFYDVNGDGIITNSEIRYGDTLVFMGASEPKYNLSMHHQVGFLNDRVRLGATFQYVHGFNQINRYLADAAFNLPVWNIPGAATPEAVAYAAAQQATSLWGYLERANTLRLNTLSLQMILPNRFARSIKASQAVVSFIGSNLAMWSSYTGADPSINTAGAPGNRVIDEGGLPTPRTWGFRIALTY